MAADRRAAAAVQRGQQMGGIVPVRQQGHQAIPAPSEDLGLRARFAEQRLLVLKRQASFAFNMEIDRQTLTIVRGHCQVAQCRGQATVAQSSWPQCKDQAARFLQGALRHSLNFVKLLGGQGGLAIERATRGGRQRPLRARPG